MKLDALIIMKDPMDEILSGKKTWEIRSRNCHKRGLIALIESKSGTIVGTAEIVDSIGPLSIAEYNRNLDKSRDIKRRRDTKDDNYYAWVLKNAKRFKEPVKYKHKNGIITWHPVNVPDKLISKAQLKKRKKAA